MTHPPRTLSEVLSWLYQWATMTPVNLLASLVLAVIGLVVLFVCFLILGWLMESVNEQIALRTTSKQSESREVLTRESFCWVVFYVTLVFGVMILVSSWR